MSPANVDPAASRPPYRVGTTFVLCVLAALIEGYDLQCAGVAAPKLAPAFGLRAEDLAWVFSINTLGMFVGAAVGGWIADRTGRKVVLASSLILFGVFSIATALASSSDLLLAARLFTGLGLGAAFPMIVAIAAEAGPSATRAVRATLITGMMPFGGAAVSLLAWVDADLEWQTLFYVGGAAPILLALAVVVLLREPRGVREALSQGSDEDVHLDTLSALFRGGRAVATASLWVSFFATLVALYLLLNWLPSLMVTSGFRASDAMLVSIAFTTAGGLGALALGALSARVPGPLLLVPTFFGMAVGVLALAHAATLAAAIAAASAAGFFIIGAQFILYGLSSAYYPIAARGRGVGAAIAVGRLGGIVGPLVAGLVLSRGGSPTQAVIALLPFVALALGCSLLLVSRSSDAEA